MDTLGRKKTLWLSNLLAIVGVALEASAQNSTKRTVPRSDPQLIFPSLSRHVSGRSSHFGRVSGNIRCLWTNHGG